MKNAHCPSKDGSNPGLGRRWLRPREDLSLASSNVKSCQSLMFTREPVCPCQEHPGDQASITQSRRSIGWTSWRPCQRRWDRAETMGKGLGSEAAEKGRRSRTYLPVSVPPSPTTASHPVSSQWQQQTCGAWKVLPFISHWGFETYFWNNGCVYSKFQEAQVKVAPENHKLWKWYTFWEGSIV